MAKIKHTKNELKAQREALTRFERFLPMLQLKKQQLQAEIQAITAQIAECDAEAKAIQTDMEPWVELLAEDVDLESMIRLTDVQVDEGNIAGVTIPIFRDALVKREQIDLFTTPTWIDDAIVAIEKLTKLRVRRQTLEEQRRLISEELRTTSQRVNLFEKVKIPEARENIRVIKIFLGDQQTAAVARGKIAKKRSEPAAGRASA